MDALAWMLSAGSSSTSSGALSSKTSKVDQLGTNPPQWQGPKHGLVLTTSGKATTKTKFNVEVNPLVITEYQENNSLQWK